MMNTKVSSQVQIGNEYSMSLLPTITAETPTVLKTPLPKISREPSVSQIPKQTIESQRLPAIKPSIAAVATLPSAENRFKFSSQVAKSSQSSEKNWRDMSFIDKYDGDRDLTASPPRLSEPVIFRIPSDEIKSPPHISPGRLLLQNATRTSAMGRKPIPPLKISSMSVSSPSSLSSSPPLRQILEKPRLPQIDYEDDKLVTNLLTNILDSDESRDNITDLPTIVQPLPTSRISEIPASLSSIVGIDESSPVFRHHHTRIATPRTPRQSAAGFAALLQRSISPSSSQSSSRLSQISIPENEQLSLHPGDLIITDLDSINDNSDNSYIDCCYPSSTGIQFDNDEFIENVSLSTELSSDPIDFNEHKYPQRRERLNPEMIRFRSAEIIIGDDVESSTSTDC